MARRPRVLIVEDDPTTGQFLVDMLSQGGYAPVLTQSAVGASALLKRLKPRVILLDLGLPFRSGASLLAELKADPRTARIPVVICTGQPRALPAARRVLAAAILPKPIDLESLLRAVREALSSGVDG